MVTRNLVLPSPENLKRRYNNQHKAIRLQGAADLGKCRRVILDVFEQIGGYHHGETFVAKGDADRVRENPRPIAASLAEVECSGRQIKGDNGPSKGRNQVMVGGRSTPQIQ